MLICWFIVTQGYNCYRETSRLLSVATSFRCIMNAQTIQNNCRRPACFTSGFIHRHVSHDLKFRSDFLDHHSRNGDDKIVHFLEDRSPINVVYFQSSVGSKRDKPNGFNSMLGSNSIHCKKSVKKLHFSVS